MPTRDVRLERPPRLALRFVLYTGLALLVVGLGILWVLQRDIETSAERRSEIQTKHVAKAALLQELKLTDFRGPVSGARRKALDDFFKTQAVSAGFLRATLFDPNGVVTYSTSRELVGQAQPSGALDDALAGSPHREELTIDGKKALRTYVPVRSTPGGSPVGVLALAQDYRVIDLEIRQALQHSAVILFLALLLLWALLIPLLRQTTRTLASRNRQLVEQANDLERALAERKLAQESEAQLAAIVEASDDAITRTDEHGSVATWNSASERLFGWSEDEILGRPLAVLVPDDRMHELSAVARQIGAGTGVEHHQTRGRRKDGSEVDVSLTVSPIHDETGRVSGAAVIARDVTNFKRQQAQLESLLAKERVARTDAEQAQQALSEQNERLRELDRLKDEFIALVSHELRTPLTSIHGYLELLLDGGAGELAAEQERFLTVVQRNSKRLMQLVGDLLFMAQVEAGKLALELDEVDLVEVVNECLEAAQPIAGEREIELESELEDTPSMLGDRSRLAQVLDNLISNALKFTPRGGRVSVRLAGAGDDAVVEIADTGVGIPSSEQSQLFERFFRSSNATEQAIPGTGLGLTIAKAIVERHDGSISIESAEGQGTTVSVRLPVRVTAEEVAA